GIPGVGEKTAVKLVKKYGSADAVLQHLDELTPKMRENFEKFGEKLPLARRLVTLKNDVEFEFDPELCKYTGLNQRALKEHFNALGFWALVKRLKLDDIDDSAPVAAPKSEAAGRAIPKKFEESLFGNLEPQSAARGPEPTPGDDCDYRLIDTDVAFQEFLRELKEQKRFAFDTETTSIEPMSAHLVGLSFSWKHAQGFYLPVKGPAGCQML